MRMDGVGDPFWKAPSTSSERTYKVSLPKDASDCSSLHLRIRYACGVKMEDLRVGFKIFSHEDDVEECQWSLAQMCGLGSVSVWEVMFLVPRGTGISRCELKCEVVFYSGEAVIVTKTFTLNY